MMNTENKPKPRPGGSRGLVCDPHGGNGGEGRSPGILVLPHPQNKLINPLHYTHLASTEVGGRNTNYSGAAVGCDGLGENAALEGGSLVLRGAWWPPWPPQRSQAGCT